MVEIGPAVTISATVYEKKLKLKKEGLAAGADKGINSPSIQYLSMALRGSDSESRSPPLCTFSRFDDGSA